MSNIKLVIEERAADIGNFMVGRLLPFRQKRMVGPFIFIDHMGPAILKPGENMDIGPHPHIGLSTLTYLFEGAIMHRDSLGSVQKIEPGAVNWMTAGKGVVHSERTPDDLRQAPKTMHGMQIWVALPKAHEQCEPSFHHIAAQDIPAWEMEGVQIKLIAGEIFGRKSPVPVYSPLYMMELKTTGDGVFDPGDALYGEAGLYVLKGEVVVEGAAYGPGQLLVAKNSLRCQFNLKAGSEVYLFGGEAFPEERFIFWNFVSSQRALIEQAKIDWLERRFPAIPGDPGYVPMP